MFLAEVVALFHTLQAFGSILSTAYSLYQSSPLNSKCLRSLGLEVSDLRHLYIANKQACLTLTQHLQLLQTDVDQIQALYASTLKCPEALSSQVQILKSTLTQAQQLVKDNILPQKLNWPQRQWWIAKQIKNARSITQRFTQFQTQIAQALTALGTAVGIQVLEVVNQSSVQQAADYTELKEYLQNQEVKIDEIFTTLLQVLEPQADQTTLQTVMSNQQSSFTWITGFQNQMLQVQEAQSQVVQQCIQQSEAGIRLSGHWNTEFAKVHQELQHWEAQLAEHTGRMVDQVHQSAAEVKDTILDVQLQLQEFVRRTLAQDLNQQNRILVEAIRSAYTRPSEGPSTEVKLRASWKYQFKELSFTDLQMDLEDPDTFLGQGVGGQVFWGRLDGREIAFKRLDLPKSRPRGTPSTSTTGGHLASRTTLSPATSQNHNSSASASSSAMGSGVSPETDFTTLALKVLKHEARVVWSLNGHPNCVQLYGICLDPGGLIFEYCNAGTLQAMLYRMVYDEPTRVWKSESLQLLKLSQKISCVTQTLNGLYFLHTKGYVHRDLKSANCLLHNYGTSEVPLLNVKLTDFGSARQIADFVRSSPFSSSSGGSGHHQSGGTLRWLAPERRQSHKLEPERKKQIENHPGVDIYGFGCVLGEIFLEVPPYAEIHSEEEIRNLGPEDLPYTEKQLQTLPKEIGELIRKCCEGRAHQRIRIEAVVYQEWPQICSQLKDTGQDLPGDGDVYQGQKNNGQKAGQGIMKYADGRVYDGQWIQDKKHGHGKMRWADGSEYIGQWREDQRDGEGRSRYSNGDIYQGGYVKDQRSGPGRRKNVDGSEYEGQYLEDQAHGYGKCISEGEKYEGQHVGGKMEGQGVYT
jgi:serine/threonine protein kinase